MNPSTIGPGSGHSARRVFVYLAASGIAFLCAAANVNGQSRPDIVIADFEGDTYGDWKTTGTAFGPGPARNVAGPDGSERIRGQGTGEFLPRRRRINRHSSLAVVRGQAALSQFLDRRRQIPGPNVYGAPGR